MGHPQPCPTTPPSPAAGRLRVAAGEKPSRLWAAQGGQLGRSGKQLLRKCSEGFARSSLLHTPAMWKWGGGETLASPETGAPPKSLRNLLVLQTSAAVPICLLISMLKTFTVCVCHQGELLSTTQLYYWKRSGGVCAVVNIAFPGPALQLSKSSVQLPASPPGNVQKCRVGVTAPSSARPPRTQRLTPKSVSRPFWHWEGRFASQWQRDANIAFLVK